MAAKPPKKPGAKRLFGVRLPDEILVALHQRAEQDRRTIAVTTELVIIAGLAALRRPRKEGKSA